MITLTNEQCVKLITEGTIKQKYRLFSTICEDKDFELVTEGIHIKFNIIHILKDLIIEYRNGTVMIGNEKYTFQEYNTELVARERIMHKKFEEIIETDALSQYSETTKQDKIKEMYREWQ